MPKRIHFLVIAAALLAWAGGCESARTSTPATGTPSEVAGAAGSNDPPSWELRLIRSAMDLSQYNAQKVDPAIICAEASCPTLEEALGAQQCQGPPSAEVAPTWQGHQYVVTGCGLTSVHRAGFIYTAYWYDGFGSPPVAVFRGNDVGAALWSQTRSIECPASEQRTCATCADGYPSCAEPGWLPEPPPPPQGCECAPEGNGGARVSLDCFCSIYPCPSFSEMVHACKHEPGDRRLSQRRASDSCGTVWFEGDQRLGYDARTGALIAAEASLVLPLVRPCFTDRVVAGAMDGSGAMDGAGADAGSACSAAAECDCNAADEAAAACQHRDWFQALVSRLPDPVPPGSAAPGIQIEPRPDTPPESPGVEANGCRFEYLGDWISCQDDVGPLGEMQPGASFDQCLSACLERTECQAVIDYHWLGRPDLGCSLFLSSCDTPRTGPWQQEDGGRHYRKVCSGG